MNKASDQIKMRDGKEYSVWSAGAIGGGKVKVKTMKSFFVFDVESVGLHGEGFAVGGGVFLETGACPWGFEYSCPIDKAQGLHMDRAWVKRNLPILKITHPETKDVRMAFWNEWIKAKKSGAIMAADCLWPVEANFISACIKDDAQRLVDSPYPFLEIASFLAAAEMDPIGTYDRQPSELPKHNPYCDAMQSARMLATALERLEELKGKD